MSWKEKRERESKREVERETEKESADRQGAHNGGPSLHTN